LYVSCRAEGREEKERKPRPAIRDSRRPSPVGEGEDQRIQEGKKEALPPSTAFLLCLWFAQREKKKGNQKGGNT